MADLTDVENALVALVAGAIYPAGTGQPSGPGMPVKIRAGWPLPQELDADLKAGTCNVTVYSRPEERNTTRFTSDWQQATVNAPVLTLTAAGQSVTVGGSIPPANNPHIAVVFANGLPYAYAVLPSDTLTTVAAALALLIVADIPGTAAAGPVITLPAGGRLGVVRVGVTGTAVRPVRTQEKLFQVSIWADTPDNRTAVSVVVDGVLAANVRVTLPDQSIGKLTYKSTLQSDKFEKDNLYRRDILYTVEYSTTQTEVATQITAIEVDTSAAIAGVEPYQPVSTSFT